MIPMAVRDHHGIQTGQIHSEPPDVLDETVSVVSSIEKDALPSVFDQCRTPRTKKGRQLHRATAPILNQQSVNPQPAIDNP